MLGLVITMEFMGDRYYNAHDMSLIYEYGCNYGSDLKKEKLCHYLSLILQTTLEKQ